MKPASSFRPTTITPCSPPGCGGRGYDRAAFQSPDTPHPQGPPAQLGQRPVAAELRGDARPTAARRDRPRPVLLLPALRYGRQPAGERAVRRPGVRPPQRLADRVQGPHGRELRRPATPRNPSVHGLPTGDRRELLLPRAGRVRPLRAAPAR